MGLILLTGKWRKALAHYCVANGLPHAGSLPDEKGWTANTNKPGGKPYRHVVQRVDNNLEARKLITAKQNDGTLNDVVQKILIPPAPKLTMGDLAVKFALKEQGVTEVPFGSNNGPRVRYYQSSTGAYGEAWCASFFWKMWQEAGYKGFTSAGAWNTTDSFGTRVLGVEHAKPGDGVSFNEGDGHIGMFLALVGDQVKTIDGNTDNEVAIRLRPVSLVHSICNPTP